ncbi:MAG: allantoicase [Gemmatimonadota bacterium]
MSGSRYWIDLASARVGGRVLVASDEFFAPKENLLKPEPPIFKAGKYTDRGKWMDGWETRRRRGGGHDWCVVGLGIPGAPRQIVVDTSHFTGNHPAACSIEAATLERDPSIEDLPSLEGTWEEVVSRSDLAGDTENLLSVRKNAAMRCGPIGFTHVRLHVYPDGGVARLRVRGEARPDWARILAGGEAVDLAGVTHGGIVLASSDEFYGAPMNLLMPGPGADMSDGWETRRRRGPGHDWVALRLGRRGVIERIEVDTSHFKGNYPESCSVDGWDAGTSEPRDGASGVPALRAEFGHEGWREILPRSPVGPHARHLFGMDRPVEPVTHVRLHIHPDGGVSRFRVFGRPVSAPAAEGS